MSHDHHLKEQLKALHLGGLLETLDVRLREARKSQLAHLDFLALLVQDELERRAWTKFDRRVRKACFSELRSLERLSQGTPKQGLLPRAPKPQPARRRCA